MLCRMAVMWRGQKVYAFQARNEARKQTELMEQQTKLLKAQAKQAPAQGAQMPAGWYSDGRAWFWWDGARWTGLSQPLQP